jgi:uncharacterized protein YxeA
LFIHVSSLCCTGVVLSIQVVFLCCIGAVFITKTTWIDKTAPMQHKNDNFYRQNSTNAA